MATEERESVNRNRTLPLDFLQTLEMKDFKLFGMNACGSVAAKEFSGREILLNGNGPKTERLAGDLRNIPAKGRTRHGREEVKTWVGFNAEDTEFAPPTA
ncbi:MAG: hypothetical protein WA817_18105 [Candidatus Acidiferrum sp.]